MRLPHILAWELTRACNLNCVHCRASATRDPGPGELTTEEGLSLLEDLAAGGTRLVILSGARRWSGRTCSLSRPTARNWACA